MSSLYLSYCADDAAVAKELMALADLEGLQVSHNGGELGAHSADAHTVDAFLLEQMAPVAAVFVLCSEQSMYSPQVQSEVHHARAAGKLMYALLVSDCALEFGLHVDRQIDLRLDHAAGWQRVVGAMRNAAGSCAEQFDWRPQRGPWRASLGYRAADAAVLYGRDAEIHAGLCALDDLLGPSPAKMLVITGPAGCGKRSLLKAGLAARARLDNARWQVVEWDPIGDRPVDDLATALVSALGFRRGARGADALINGMRECAMTVPLPEATQRFDDLVAQLCEESKVRLSQQRPTPLLVLPTLDTCVERRDPLATHLLTLIGSLLKAEVGGLRAAVSVDTSSLQALLQHPALTGLQAEILEIHLLTEHQLWHATLGPARRAAITLEAGFVQALSAQLSLTPEGVQRQASWFDALRALWQRHPGTDYFAIRDLDDLLAATPAAPTDPRALRDLAGLPQADEDNAAEPVADKTVYDDSTIPSVDVAQPDAAKPPPLQIEHAPTSAAQASRPRALSPPAAQSAKAELQQTANELGLGQEAIGTNRPAGDSGPQRLPSAASRPVEANLGFAALIAGVCALAGIALLWSLQSQPPRAATGRVASSGVPTLSVAAQETKAGAATRPTESANNTHSKRVEAASRRPHPAQTRELRVDAESEQARKPAQKAAATADMLSQTAGSIARQRRVIQRVLQSDAPLTGLLLLTSLDGRHYPRHGLRAAMQVDSQQLPASEAPASTTAVRFVRLNLTEQLFAAGSHDELTVTRTADGRRLKHWRGEGFVDAAISNDGIALLTLHDDGKARWRRIEDQPQPRSLGSVLPPAPGDGWSEVVFSTDDRSAWVVARHALTRLTLDGSSPPIEELTEAGKLRDITRTADGYWAITTQRSQLGTYRWQPATSTWELRSQLTLRPHSRRFLAAQVAINGTIMITADVNANRDGRRPRHAVITRWRRRDARRWQRHHVARALVGQDTVPRASVAISADGSTALATLTERPLATGEHDRHQIWSLQRAQWRQRRTLPNDVQLAADGSVLLHRAIDGQAQVLGASGGGRFLGGAEVTAMSILRGRHVIVTGHADGAVRSWRTLKSTTTRLGWQPVRAVAPDPSGSQIAAVVAGPPTSGLASIADGPAAGTMLRHVPAAMANVLTHVSGERALHNDGTHVYIWRTRRAEAPMVAPLPQCPQKLQLHFTADGRHVIADCNGTRRALLVQWAEILDALRDKTSACLPADQRESLLEEPPKLAAQRARRCSQR